VLSNTPPAKSRLVATPLGEMRALVDEDGALCGLDFIHRIKRSADPSAPSALQRATLDAVVVQIDEYFAGKRRVFDLPLAPRGTPFQLRDWSALLEIPYGETTTYGAIAARIGSVSRAVGTANGSNPISIVIPCHRVIGANGKLVGYGGGLDRKAALLDLESKNVRLF
jgi:methylated-DNA-[protein]-cysteine S-methyltransferase